MMTGEGDRDATDDWVDDLVAGRVGYHQVPAAWSADDAARARRRALERLSGSELEHIGRYSLDAERAASAHCENFIGAAQIPMGIVGPLLVRGLYVDDAVSVPMATTEGALLASVNRGCRAIAGAGGADVRVEEIGMTRAPVFRAAGVVDARRFIDWVCEHESEIRDCAHQTSRFLRLLEIDPANIGSTVFLRFRFSTGDAMGMNMATIACDRIVREVITPATGVPCVALSGNYCVDKKPASVNFVKGRGKRIQAEVVLSRDVLQRVLKARADELVEVQYRKNLLGSIAAGAMGHNSHTANILAAVFLATGQDPAHVVEGSMAVTTIEASDDDGVRFAVYLPALPIGAVGGGTALQTQAEGLRILGVEADPAQPGKAVMRLAEILGAVVLAGEISLMSALASQDLASAHERLGR